MGKPPADAKLIDGLTGYGVDENGDWVFFGFKDDNGKASNFYCDRYRLGATIGYLTAIAREAQQRRLTLDPYAGNREAQGKQSNPVLNLDFEPSVDGTSAILIATTSTGITEEIQLPIDLLEKMIAQLPSLIDEMKRRFEASKKKH